MSNKNKIISGLVLGLAGVAGAFGASTYSNLVGDAYVLSQYENVGTFVVKGQVDLSDFSTAVAPTDVIQVIRIPSNTYVFSVMYRVTTALTNASSATNSVTLYVGDGADVDGWVWGVDATNRTYNFGTKAFTAGTLTGTNFTGVVVTNAGVGYTSGKLYTADDTIDVWFSSSLANLGSKGIYDVRAVCVPVARE